jgi:predicted permease
MGADRLSPALARMAAVALRAAPRAFRAEYGADITAALTTLLADERARRGTLPMLMLWGRGLADAIRTAARERRAARWATPLWPFGDLGADIRAALRSSWRSPGISLTIVLTLVFGIGLAAAIFAFADGYLFRPLPYADPDQLYLVRAPDARGEFLRAAEADALRASPVGRFGFVDGERSSPLSSGRQVRIGDRTVPLRFSGIGEGFGTVTGVKLMLGRHFTAEEHRGIEPVPVWLTHRTWLREFGGDRDVLGRRYSVEGDGRRVEVEIVGVTDPAVTTFDANFGRSNTLPDGFAPARPRQPDSGRVVTLATPVVRLPPGTSPAQAEAEIGAALQHISPARAGGVRFVRLDSLQDEHVKAGRPTAVLLMIGAALALALVTVNLVYLLLTRGAARAREIATRAALGASRWRISRLFLVESLLHGAAGVTGGLLLARWLTISLAANIPTRGTDAGTLALVTMAFDARVAAFAIVSGMIVAALGGIWPAWRAAGMPLVAAARTQSGAGPRLSARTSRAILASEVAISSVVLTGAVFAGIGIWRYLNQPIGRDMTDRFSVAFPVAGQTAATGVDWPAVRRGIADASGIRAVSGTFSTVREPVRIGDRELDPRAVFPIAIGPGGVEAMGLHLLAGRSPTPEDGLDTVALVDDRFARMGWPDGSPLGQRVHVGAATLEIIGVIAHPRFSLASDSPPVVVVPGVAPLERTSLTVWAPGLTETELTERIAAVLRTLAPGHRPNVAAHSFDRAFGDDVANVRFQRPIVIVLGAFAFLVAGVGLFGLVAYLVEQRTRDFGILVALGARPAHIWRDLLRQSLVPAAIGVLVGLGAASALAGVMRAGMFGWESSAPLSMSTVGAIMLVVATLAAAFPARRVIRTDPSVTLRAE